MTSTKDSERVPARIAEELMILQRDGLGRVRVSAAKREEILAAFDRSGLSGAAFARSVGVESSCYT